MENLELRIEPEDGWKNLDHDVSKVEVEEGTEKIPRELSCGDREIKLLRLPGSICDVESLGEFLTEDGTPLDPHMVIQADPHSYVYHWAAAHHFPVQELNMELPSTEEALDYEISNGVLISYQGTDPIAKIPSGVTRIAPRAFQGNSQLIGVRFPRGLREICEYAFAEAKQLVAVMLPEGLEEIGKEAFAFCDSLKLAYVPDSVETLWTPFYGSEQGLRVAVSEGSYADGQLQDVPRYPAGKSAFRAAMHKLEDEALSAIEPVSPPAEFEIEDTTLVAYHGPGGDVVIPDGVTKIADGAFKDYKTLYTVTIPEGVTELGSMPDNSGYSGTAYFGRGVFHGCTHLLSVRLPQSLRVIGDAVFQKCKSLYALEIPAGVTAIGESAFSWCSSLTSLDLPKGLPMLPRDIFYECTRLTSVTCGDQINSIGHGAFYNCAHLESFLIPDSVTKIGSSAFSHSGLRTLKIPAAVTDYGRDIAAECKRLDLLEFEGGHREIKLTEPGMLSNLESCTQLLLPRQVSFIDEDVFLSRGQESPTIDVQVMAPPDSYAYKWADANDCLSVQLQEDGSYTVDGTLDCGTLYIPEWVTELGEVLCDDASHMVLPDSLKTIKADTPWSIAKLEELRIPDGVETLPLDILQWNSFEHRLRLILSEKLRCVEADPDWLDFYQKHLVIAAPAGSYAMNWAKEHGFQVEEFPTAEAADAGEVSPAQAAPAEGCRSLKEAAEAMKTYKELLDLEIITQAEFDRKKKELLGL